MKRWSKKKAPVKNDETEDRADEGAHQQEATPEQARAKNAARVRWRARRGIEEPTATSGGGERPVGSSKAKEEDLGTLAEFVHQAVHEETGDSMFGVITTVNHRHHHETKVALAEEARKKARADAAEKLGR